MFSTSAAAGVVVDSIIHRERPSHLSRFFYHRWQATCHRISGHTRAFRQDGDDTNTNLPSHSDAVLVGHSQSASSASSRMHIYSEFARSPTTATVRNDCSRSSNALEATSRRMKYRKQHFSSVSDDIHLTPRGRMGGEALTLEKARTRVPVCLL